MSKAAKHRFCPAVQREISAAECGENRGSRYACPAACAFSPLASANYSLLLKLEDEVDRKTADRLAAAKLEQPALRKMAQQASASLSPHAFHAFCEHVLFFQRDAAGTSLTERWRGEGFPGLKNDERVLMEAKMRTRVALLEIHRIIDDEQIEAVDLLAAAPAPILLRDRSLASMAQRFGTVLVWIYPLPHYWRLSGTAILIPEFAQFEPAEIVRETARHLGGPTAENELRLWLAENFVRIDESLMATGRMRRQQMFAGMDAQFGKAVYELRAPFAACRAALDEVAEVEPDTLSQAERDEGFADARVWTNEQAQTKVAGTSFMLGRVLLGQSHCRLECIGAERMARLRRQFEELMGERVRFAGERLDDLPSKMTGKEPSPDMALIPPKLLEQPTKIVLGTSLVAKPHTGATLEEMEANERVRLDRAFLDDPIPALDGQAPRAAAQDAALRPKLLRLMKQRVRQQDEANLRTGRRDDINWMLRDLGLTEILFDAPPPRPIPAQYAEPDEFDETEDDPENSIDDSGFPLPVLPPEPFSQVEVATRLKTIMDESETAKEALDYLDACGSMFIEDAASLCEKDLEPGEFGLFVPSLIQARFILVPRGFREPDWNYDRLADSYYEALDRFNQPSQGSDPGAIQKWLDHSRQPILTLILALQLMESFQELPKKMRPTPGAEFLMIITLNCMIDELDQTIRE